MSVLFVDFTLFAYLFIIRSTVLSLNDIGRTKDVDDGVREDLDQALSQEIRFAIEEAKQAADVLVDSFGRTL